MISRNRSAPTTAAMSIECTTSANSTVTCLYSAWVSCAVTGAPQPSQNRAPARNSVPHVWHAVAAVIEGAKRFADEVRSGRHQRHVSGRYGDVSLLPGLLSQHSIHSCPANAERASDGGDWFATCLHSPRQCRFRCVERLGSTDLLHACPTRFPRCCPPGGAAWFSPAICRGGTRAILASSLLKTRCPTTPTRRPRWLRRPVLLGGLPSTHGPEAQAAHRTDHP
jgi:hypothetical protein